LAAWVASTLLLLADAPAFAQNQGGGQTMSTPSPAEPPPAASALACAKDIPEAVQGVRSDVVVDLDPDTLWRPRGSEVRFTFGANGTSAAPKIAHVVVCFRWTDGGPRAPAHAYLASPLVRSVPNNSGLAEYGAIVPELPPADSDALRAELEALGLLDTLDTNA